MNQEVSTEVAIESVLHAPWPLPIWLTIVVAVGLFVAILWLYLSERGGSTKALRVGMAALRFFILALILWMLAGWTWQRFRSDRPELLVVIDTSASMGARDVAVGSNAAQISRFDYIKQLFAAIEPRRQAEIGRGYQLKWFGIADKLNALDAKVASGDAELSRTAEQVLKDLEPNGLESRLGESLNRLIDRQAGRGTAAIVFLSDGISTSGTSLSDVATAARRAAVPIYTVVIGQQFVQPDLRLSDLLVDREVYFGDQVAAEVSVVASDIPEATARISLIDESTNRILDTTTVELAADQNQQTVRLAFVPDRSGEIPLRLQVDPVRGEIDNANNSLKAVVQVQDKSIRVLLVFESPSYEFRFLKSLLERIQEGGEVRSSSFVLQSILQDADPTYVEQDATAMRLVPTTSEALFEYDVFIFGELNPSLISRNAQQAMVDAVTQKGSGSIFVSGTGSSLRALQNWPLGKLLPVEINRNVNAELPALVGPWQWKPTSMGMASLPMQLAASPRETRAIWDMLPPIRTLADVGRGKTGSQVLAEAVSLEDASTAPLLITQFAGAGRTALQATDESYVLSSVGGSDQYHQRYWGQLLRWLSRGKLSRGLEQSSLVVDPKQARLGQPIRLQLALGTNSVSDLDMPNTAEIMLETSDGTRQSYELKRSTPNTATYQIVLDKLPPGKYRAVLLRPVESTPPDVEFTVTAPPGEQANLRADQEAMQNLAEQSRGRSYTTKSAPMLFSQLPEGKPTRLGSLPPLPLWNSQIVALIFVILLTIEWLLRRKARML